VGADGTIYVADKDNSAVRAIAPDGGATRTIVSAAQGIDQPFCVRFDSHNNIITVDTPTGQIKHLDLTTAVITPIGAPIGGTGWQWLDVDRYGNVGPLNDIFLANGFGPDNQSTYRMSADGTRVSDWGSGHYPWAICIHRTEEIGRASCRERV